MMFEKIRELIFDVPGLYLEKKEEIDLESDLFHDIGMDSLDMVELSLEVEREFKVRIPDIEIEKWHVVQDIIDTVNQLKKEK